jgi:hypothetical protein
VKKLLVLAVTFPFVFLVAFAGSASAAEAGGCQLHGTANISPGLSNNAQDFSYSFSGALSNCQSSTIGAPTNGGVFAGTNGLPVPSGNGSCANSTTSGIAVVQWADGSTTVVQYTTTGALAAVALQGTVIGSVTTSSGTTYSTTRYPGDTAFATLAFEPPDPTACTGAGVTTAGIDGVVGLGSGS